MIAMKSLKVARTERLWRQEDLAKAAKLGIFTIFRAEQGETIEMLTAQKILRALNLRGKELGLSELTLKEIDLTIKE